MNVHVHVHVDVDVDVHLHVHVHVHVQTIAHRLYACCYVDYLMTYSVDAAFYYAVCVMIYYDTAVQSPRQISLK